MADTFCTMNVQLFRRFPIVIRQWGPLWSYSCFWRAEEIYSGNPGSVYMFFVYCCLLYMLLRGRLCRSDVPEYLKIAVCSYLCRTPSKSSRVRFENVKGTIQRNVCRYTFTNMVDFPNLLSHSLCLKGLKIQLQLADMFFW